MRSLRLVLNILGTFGTRAVNLFSTLLMVPMAVRGLGGTDYGAFAIILSFAVFIAYADFGMGQAMVNPITDAENRKDYAAAQYRISQTFNLLLWIAATILVIGLLVVALYFGLGGPPGWGSQAMPWFVFVFSVAISLPSAIPQRVLFALERNFEANIWLSVGRIAALAGVFVAYHLHGMLSFYVFAMIGIPGLIGWINTYWLFCRSRKDLAPSFGMPWKSATVLLPSGLRFTTLQMGNFVIFGVDVVLVGIVLGHQAAASFDLITRAFNYVPALAIIGVQPLWPAIRAALVAGDRRWVAKIQRRANLVILGVTVLPVVILGYFYHEIILWWSGLSVYFSPVIVWSLAIISVTTAQTALSASIVMAAEGERRLFLVQFTFIVVLLVGKVVFLNSVGLIGLVVTTLVINVPRVIWIEYLRRSVAKTDFAASVVADVRT